MLNSEVSPIDTCLFLCGALTCRGYFDDKEIQGLATELYERIDWTWILHGGQTLSMGWMPEQGFLKIALGHLQRNDDDVHAGNGVANPSVAASGVE